MAIRNPYRVFRATPFTGVLAERYLSIKMLVDLQKVLLAISPGSEPLVHAMEVTTLRKSWAWGKVPGSASFISSLSNLENELGWRGALDLELTKRAPLSIGELLRNSMRLPTGHIARGSERKGRTSILGVLLRRWFLYRNPGNTQSFTIWTGCKEPTHS